MKNKPLSIAYFVNQYPKVSHSFIRREILALEQQGFQVQRLALRGWDAELVDREDIAERRRTKYVLQQGVWGLIPAVLKTCMARPGAGLRTLRLALQMRHLGQRSWPYHLIYFAEACRLLQWMRRAKVRHVHAHFGTNSAEVVMLAQCLGGPSYSFTVHGAEDFADGLLEKYQRAAFVVAVSSYGRSQLYLRTPQTAWHKAEVVHCGLEPEFREIAENRLPSTPRLVCVGRLCVEKGQLLLLEAVYLLKRRGVNLQLVLAGDGEMRQEIEERIQQLDIAQEVHITGWLSSQQVRAEMIAARGMVLPSFSEGLPVVIMESMALCRPVLATYVAGIPELVRHGQEGWLFPAGDVIALAEAMHACLAATDQTILAMGQRARQRVLERHSIEIEIEKLATRFRQSIVNQPTQSTQSGTLLKLNEIAN